MISESIFNDIGTFLIALFSNFSLELIGTVAIATIVFIIRYLVHLSDSKRAKELFNKLAAKHKLQPIGAPQSPVAYEIVNTVITNLTEEFKIVNK